MRYCGSQGYFFYSPMAYGGGSSALSSKSIILCAFCGIVIDGFMKIQKRCRTAKGSCRHAEILLQNRERKMHTMLDLRNMSDAEFSISVAPPAPQSVLQVTIHEDDHVQLNRSWQASLPKSPSSSDSIRTSPHCRLRCQRSRMQITLPSPRAGAKQSVELQITFAKPTYRSRSSFAEFFWTVPQNGEENVKQTLSESNRQLPAPQGRNRQTAEKI